METRNKKSTGTQDAETRDLAARQFELEQIEKAMQEKERRIKQIELAHEERTAALERERRNFEHERKLVFNKLGDLEAREKEIEKKWQDLKSMQLEGTATNSPPLTRQPLENSVVLPPVRIDNLPEEIQTPRVSFREATDSVPYFDGYNIPLAQFTRACRRAREIIPPFCERNLTKLLINKLGKRAYYAVEDEPCNSVTDLIDLLTDAFGTAKTLDQYRGELSIIYLKPGEHILDFISRVKDLRISILDSERRERGDLDPRFISEIDDLTARSFYQGLPLEYRLQIRPSTHMHYTEMFSAARTIAKQSELDKQRAGTRLFPTNKNAQGYNNDDRYGRARDTRVKREYDSRYHDPPRNEHRVYGEYQSSRHDARTGMQRPVDIHNEYRHRRDAPPISKYGERREQGTMHNSVGQGRDTRDRPQLATCHFCKYTGHTIDECRKKKYAERRSANSGNLPGPSGYRRDTVTQTRRTGKQ